MQKSDSQKWENLTVEIRFIPDSPDLIMFFDHYAHEYRTQKSELDNYLAKLAADGWEQKMGLGWVSRRPKHKRVCI
jgi:hypothetical protein